MRLRASAGLRFRIAGKLAVKTIANFALIFGSLADSAGRRETLLFCKRHLQFIDIQGIASATLHPV
jgi:hypothetical protein